MDGPVTGPVAGAAGRRARQAPEPVLFLFLDGVGLGPGEGEGSAVNPLAQARMPVIGELIGGPLTAEREPRTENSLLYRSLDARLGVEGLPQSATGQTTLLTGLNSAQLMERHYGPWPGPTLTAVLQEGTLFHEARALGGAVLANAYPDDYFRVIDTRRFRPHAPVVAARSADVELRGMDRYRAGEAVAADLSGRRFAERLEGVAAQPPEAAAEVLAELARGATLTFFDLWTTDAVGHARNAAEAVSLLERLDALVGGLVKHGAGRDFTLVMTSDHGNLEDLSTKGHTLNQVPLLVLSERAAEFSGAHSLLDVAPGVRRLWVS